MSKPDDITDAIWDATKAVAVEIRKAHEIYHIEPIARALMAAEAREREACAAHLEAVVTGRIATKRNAGNNYLLAAAASIRRRGGE